MQKKALVVEVQRKGWLMCWLLGLAPLQCPNVFGTDTEPTNQLGKMLMLVQPGVGLHHSPRNGAPRIPTGAIATLLLAVFWSLDPHALEMDCVAGCVDDDTPRNPEACHDLVKSPELMMSNDGCCSLSLDVPPIESDPYHP